MSQPEINQEQPEEKAPSKEEVIKAFEQAPTNTEEKEPTDDKEETSSNPKDESSQNEPEKQSEKKTKHKKLSRKTIIIISVFGWILLLGLGVGLAFLLKPAPEEIHTNAIIESYKYSESESKEVIETVDDLDYYGYYKPNPLSFTKIREGDASGTFTISGLKDKSVEEKINNRIIETAINIKNNAPDNSYLYTTMTANLFNILSLKMQINNYTTGLTFDLNTGDELSFDDLFPKNINLNSLLFNSFYSTLSTNIQFSKLAAERRLSSEEICPDPSQCMAQYSPNPGETYDSLRSLIADYDNQLANIEQIAMDSLQSYLSSEKKFYINSYGPTFITPNNEDVKMELKDNIKYALYLKKYRSAESLFENEPDDTNPFFTETSEIGTRYYNIETDSYLFDYVAANLEENITPVSAPQIIRDYILTRELSATENSQKFNHILVESTTVIHNNTLNVSVNSTIYETDKDYYNSTYKKAIINGKTQDAMAHIRLPRVGQFDENLVTMAKHDGYSFLVSNSGKIVNSVDEMLIDPTDSEMNWKEYISNVAYNKNCHSLSQPEWCNTFKEKSTEDLIFLISHGDIGVRIKDDSESGSSYLSTISLREIDRRYINPDIFVSQ